MKKIERRKDEGNVISRYTKSIGHAMDGINYAIENEHNMIAIMIYAVVILFLAVILPVTLIETIIIVLVVGFAIIIEMLNTSIEAAVDLVTTSENQLAKIAKDTASSANFIMVVISIIVNLIIFVPKLINFFGGII